MNRLRKESHAPSNRMRRLTRFTAFSGAALVATAAMAWMAFPIGMWAHGGGSATGETSPVATPLALATATTSATTGNLDLPEETPTLASRLSASRILGLCGMTPDLLAAAGVTRAELIATFADMTNTATDDRAAFAQAIQAKATAKASVTGLKKAVSAPTATREDRTNLATAESVLASATAAMDSLRSDMVARVGRGIGDAKAQKLTLAMTNRKNWHLAPEYLVVNRTEAEWVHLRDALAERRICTTKGTLVSQATTEFLARVESDAAMQAAASGIRENKSTVTAEWQDHDAR